MLPCCASMYVTVTTPMGWTQPPPRIHQACTIPSDPGHHGKRSQIKLSFQLLCLYYSFIYISMLGYPSLEINSVYHPTHGLSGFLNRLLLTLNVVVSINLHKHISS